jgi:hypothetical protein
MEAITRIAQIAKPMIVFTVFLLQDDDCEASSNYGAIAQGAIEGFSQDGLLPLGWSLGAEALLSEWHQMATIEVRTGAPDDTNSM